MGLVCLDNYYDLNAAEIARGALNTEGIPAFVFDHHYLGLAWYMTTALGGARVMVPCELLTEARDVLAYARDHEISGDEIDICPNCDRHDVVRLYSWWSVPITLCFAAAAPFVFGRSRRRCIHCNHSWRARI